MNEAYDTRQQLDQKVKFRKPSHDLSGRKFGRLTVTGFSHFDKHRIKHWNCICDCGNQAKIAKPNLISGHTKSCGCLRREQKAALKHGHSSITGETPEYRAWKGLKTRTLNPKVINFHRYGGRGIKVCERWLGSFENFLEDMGKRPSPLHTIDRINNDGDYEPTNCRWATKKQQARSRCSSRHIEHNGQTKTLAEWAEQTGMDWDTLGERLKRGWSIEKSLTTKVRSLLRTK